MEFIKIIEAENNIPIKWIVYSLEINHLFQIEDVIIKQIILEAVNKLSNAFAEKFDIDSHNSFMAVIQVLNLQFIGEMEMNVWEIPKIIRLYTEVMKEMGFSNDTILESLEKYDHRGYKKDKIKTEDIDKIKCKIHYLPTYRWKNNQFIELKNNGL